MKNINWNDQKNEQLTEAFLALKSQSEAKCFLRDLMTQGEIEEFSRRLEAARLLTQATPYFTIIKNTSLSSTTIARISKWLKGPLGGYRLILNRLHHNHSQNPVGKGLSWSS